MNEPTSLPPAVALRLALVVSATMFMAQLDSTIIQTAIPAIAAAFRVRPVDLGQGITIFITAQIVLLPASSWIAERYGVRAVYGAAIAGFSLASLLCGLCHTYWQFIACRFLQGGAAALMTPVGRLAILRTVGKEDLLRVMTITTVPMLVAPTIGPAVGGYLATYYTWPWIFYINVPLGALGLILSLRWLPEIPGERRSFDVLGFASTCAALAGTMYGLDLLARDASHPAAWLMLAAGGLTGWYALRYLRRHPAPLFSLAAARDPVFALVGLTAGATVRLSMRALPFLLPLMFQLSFGWNAFRTGLALLFISAGDLLMKAGVRPVFNRYGFRKALLWSSLGMGITIFLCAFFSPATPFWVICVVLSIMSGCRSLSFSGSSTVIYADLPAGEINSASLIWNVVQQVSNALGITLSVMCLNLTAWLRRHPTGAPDVWDYRIAIATFGVIAVIAGAGFRRLHAEAGAAFRTPRG